MKKWLIVCLLAALALLLAVGVFLTVRFLGLFQSGQEATEPSAALSVEDYAQTYLTGYTAQLDGQTLTLTKPAGLTYAEACKHGGSIYEGELAPETYLPQVQSIALDIAAKCGMRGVSVILQYESSDGEAIFSVSSDGTVQTCWAAP